MARGLLALLCILACLLPASGWAAGCSDAEVCGCCVDASPEPPTARRPSCCEVDGSSAPAAAAGALLGPDGLDVPVARPAPSPVVVRSAAGSGASFDERTSARAPPTVRRRLARLSHWLL